MSLRGGLGIPLAAYEVSSRFEGAWRPDHHDELSSSPGRRRRIYATARDIPPSCVREGYRGVVEHLRSLSPEEYDERWVEVRARFCDRGLFMKGDVLNASIFPRVVPRAYIERLERVNGVFIRAAFAWLADALEAAERSGRPAAHVSRLLPTVRRDYLRLFEECGVLTPRILQGLRGEFRRDQAVCGPLEEGPVPLSIEDNFCADAGQSFVVSAPRAVEEVMRYSEVEGLRPAYEELDPVESRARLFGRASDPLVCIYYSPFDVLGEERRMLASSWVTMAGGRHRYRAVKAFLERREPFTFAPDMSRVSVRTDEGEEDVDVLFLGTDFDEDAYLRYDTVKKILKVHGRGGVEVQDPPITVLLGVRELHRHLWEAAPSYLSGGEADLLRSSLPEMGLLSEGAGRVLARPSRYAIKREGMHSGSSVLVGSYEAEAVRARVERLRRGAMRGWVYQRAFAMNLAAVDPIKRYEGGRPVHLGILPAIADLSPYVTYTLDGDGKVSSLHQCGILSRTSFDPSDPKTNISVRGCLAPVYIAG